MNLYFKFVFIKILNIYHFSVSKKKSRRVKYRLHNYSHVTTGSLYFYLKSTF